MALLAVAGVMQYPTAGRAAKRVMCEPDDRIDAAVTVRRSDYVGAEPCGVSELSSAQQPMARLLAVRIAATRLS